MLGDDVVVLAACAASAAVYEDAEWAEGICERLSRHRDRRVRSSARRALARLRSSNGEAGSAASIGEVFSLIR